MNFYNISNLKISWSDDELLSIQFTDESVHYVDMPKNLRWVYDYLNRYYDIVGFCPLEFLDNHTFTEFAKSVYKELLKVPVGEVITYSELAFRIGCKKGARAVGNIMRKNRFPILIPCHRVVSKNGLGGFSGGLDVKKKLLYFEKMIKRR